MYSLSAKQNSRRALLKFLGVGAGMIVVQTFPGCGWVSERLRTEPAQLAPQAQKVKDDLIKESVKAWKSVLKAQNKIETVNADELERRVGYAKRTMLQMLDELDAQGVTGQMDEQLRALPERFEYPEKVKNYYRKEFKDVLTSQQYKQLEEFLAKPGTNEPAQHVLREGGISPYLRKKLNKLQVKPAAELNFQPAVAWAWPDWGCTAAICLTAAAMASWACQFWGWNTEACIRAWIAAGAACATALILCD